VLEVDSTQPNTQRRRSERVSESLPLIVRGVDLLGQPFEERTSILTCNLHGCRYASKHHLPKNTWVTLELPQAADRRAVRARVAWIQRPHSVRELFQIAVELESPSNIWGLDEAPTDWKTPESPLHPASEPAARENPRIGERPEAEATPATIANFMGKLMNDMSTGSPASSEPPLFTPAADSPLLRELRAELERHARQAAENAAAEAHEQVLRAAEKTEEKRSAAAEAFLRQWKEELDRAQVIAREQLSAQLDAKQENLLFELTSGLEETSGRLRELMAELDRKCEVLRAEREAAQEASSRMAQARLHLEASETTRVPRRAEASQEDTSATEAAAANWRQTLESEVTAARAQWNELLQSSLDSSTRRLVEQLAGRSEEVLRSAENRLTERFAELQKPFAQATDEGRNAAANIKIELEQEVSRAWSSLAEIEHAAGRVKEYSAQLEAASHDSLNQLHRRLENILEAQTAEMSHRAEGLAAGLTQRVTPALDALGREFVERTAAEVESKIAPHVERVPGMLRELMAREAHAEESLRLHRERLRQSSENNQREVSMQMTATLADLRNNFEAVRKEALAKWNEELDASGVRASHTAGESIGRASEWFQQEARARLQVLVEQAIGTAGSNLEQKAAEGGQKFETQLAGLSSAKLSHIQQQLDGVAGEALSRTQSQLDDAAAATAASFGQVLRDISKDEVQRFAITSHSALQERTEELEVSTRKFLHDFEASASTSLEHFRTQLTSQLETRVAEGRDALAAEFESALNGYRAERDACQRESLAILEQMSHEAAEKYQERLQTTGDSWVVSSVRRLNEHGQDAIESLMRSADQSLRDSCAKLFEGLSEILRDQKANAGAIASFAPVPAHEVPETTASPREAISNNAGA